MRGFTVFVNPQMAPKNHGQITATMRRITQLFKKAFKADSPKRQQQLFKDALYFVTQHARDVKSNGPQPQLAG